MVENSHIDSLNSEPSQLKLNVIKWNYLKDGLVLDSFGASVITALTF